MDEHIAKKARHDLALLNGDPPYNIWSNICYSDGYYAYSLERQYGMSIKELEKVSGYKERKEKAAKIMRNAEEEVKKILGLD